jgi:hypothetical protein
MGTLTQHAKTIGQPTPAALTTTGQTRFGHGGAANSIHHLQRTIGNQALQRLLGSQGASAGGGQAGTDTDSDVEGAGPLGQAGVPAGFVGALPGGDTRAVSQDPVGAALHGPGWDFSGISSSSPDRMSRPLPGASQAKPVVGQVNDPREHEADHIAEQVIRMPAPLPPASGATVQRKCACEEAAPEEGQRSGSPTQTMRLAGLSRVAVQRCDDRVAKSNNRSAWAVIGNPAGTLARQPALAGNAGISPRLQRTGEPGNGNPVVSSVLEVVGKGGGQPLGDGVRSNMETRFGVDFSAVRIHTDAKAARSAAAVHSRAYTVGNEIVFNSGAYAPDTSQGLHTLAHELTHVVQQSNGPVSGNDTGAGIAISDPADNFERAAEANADRVMRMPVEAAAASMCGGTVPQQTCQRHVAASEAQADTAPSPAVQRQTEQTSDQSWAKGPTFGPATAVAETEAAKKIAAIIDAMRETATTIIPFTPPAVASNPAASGPPTAQALAIPDVVQRSGALATLQREQAGGGASGEAGVVGSAQICYNLCSGEVSLVGWIWVGAGIKLWGGWYGAYYFWEGSRVIGQLEHLTCGTCSPSCGGGKETKESGWGIAGFPVAIPAGDWARFKKLGLEVGLLITPHSFCDADLELVALFDLLEYIPSLKPPLTAAEKAAEVLGIHLACGLGFDLSGSVHLCKDAQGHTTADNAKVCAGAFIGCGVGLSHDKASLPGGQHPVPA